MKDSKIEWTDHTFNPWIGCTKVSPGCAHCYAETLMDTRMGRARWGKGQPRARTSASNWKQPLRWDRAARIERDATQAAGLTGTAYRRPRVFCASLADWLDDEVPIEWLADLLDLIRRTPHLDWLLLTKRPENWAPRMWAVESELVRRSKVAGVASESDRMVTAWIRRREAPANVWLGTTVEDQQRADERIPELLRTPARVRFLSCEPLLGPVNLTSILKDGIGRDALRVNDASMGESEHHLDWVICGGESGTCARPMHPAWARSLRDQCAAAGVPYLFKQWGEWIEHHHRPEAPRFMGWEFEFDDIGGMVRNPNKSFRLLDGVEHNGFPEV